MEESRDLGLLGDLQNAVRGEDTSSLTSLLQDFTWSKKDLHLGLLQAVVQGCSRSALCLLQHGAQPEVAKCGVSHEPLIVLAARSSDVDLVKMLVQYGCNMNRRSRSGRAALHEAILLGEAGCPVLEALLDKGANPDLQDLQEGCSPLTLALRRGSTAQQELLIAAGCRLDRHNVTSGNTPLMEAAGRGDLAAVAMLLAAGAECDARGKDAKTALHLAACNGHLQVACRLLAAGSHMDRRDVMGFTPAMLAAQEGHPEVTQMFLQSGCSRDMRTLQSETMLHLAAEGGLLSSVAELTSSMVDVDVRDVIGRSPLSCAVEGRHFQVARLLIQHGLDPNVGARCPLGVGRLRPLMDVALMNADLDTADLLLQARGVTLRQLRALEACPVLHPVLQGQPQVAVWLGNAVRRPTSLLSACRHTIRQHLRHYKLRHHVVSRLGLPALLQNYVKFETV